MPDVPPPAVPGYESWGRLPDAPPARAVPVGWRHALPVQGGPGELLAYGRGRSYGDVCLNGGRTVLDTRGLDRAIAFDTQAGVLHAEAGMTLAEVLARIVPHGWFLPVTPGTKYVTLGGAVANDVHGKNHHVAGTFGRFVTELGLVRSVDTETPDGVVPAGERIAVRPGDPLFAATVGGLGLTGLITDVALRLHAIETDQIRHTTTKFRSLDAFFELSEAASARNPYVVAWLDVLRPEGRGLLMEGDHATRAELGPDAALPAPGDAARPRLSVPVDAPSWALGTWSVKAFNAAYYGRQRRRVAQSRGHYEPFFYPLDAVGAWNRGYGRRGFYQYQFVVPLSDGAAAVRDVLARLAAARAGSFLAVLKTFGDVPSPGLLSFPMPGVTLALDLPNRGAETVRLLRACDAVVREAGGRVYPAKDACMTPESFRAFFPAWAELAAAADPAFSSTFWRRVTAD